MKIGTTKKTKRMHSWQKLVLIVFLLLLVSMTTSSFMYWYIKLRPIYKIVEYEMDVYVRNKVGFNTDTDAVHFGIVAPGSGGERFFKITTGEYKSLITFYFSGDIAEWVSVSENNFVLDANETKRITVHVDVPPDIPVPSYRDGALRVVFRKI